MFALISQFHRDHQALKMMHKHRKASTKNSSKLNKFLHSEVNQLIQHIIVQDQDGQNNNTLIFCDCNTHNIDVLNI